MFEEPRRTLGIREKQILYNRAGRKCQACGKKIDFTEMQTGHKVAASKGGKANLRNSVCLCYACNKLQGTENWNTFLKKMGKKPEGAEIKDALRGLSMRQLKALTEKYNMKVKGHKEEGFLSDSYKPPSRRKYVSALSKLSIKQIRSIPTKLPSKKKKKKKKSSGWFF